MKFYKKSHFNIYTILVIIIISLSLVNYKLNRVQKKIIKKLDNENIINIVHTNQLGKSFKYYKPFWSIFYAEINKFDLKNLKDIKFNRINFDDDELFLKHNIIVESIFDPFLFNFGTDDTLYLFYEISYFDTNKDEYRSGDIFFSSKKINEEHWSFGGPILKRKNKTSFPFIFNKNDRIFMIPETSSDENISLYEFEKKNFPNNLKFKKILLSRLDFQDNYIFEYNGVDYLFSSTDNDTKLRIYYSDDFLKDEFIEHPMSPILKDNFGARAAGKIFYLNGKLYRPSQNLFHGNEILFNEITKLTKFEYQETKSNSILNIKNKYGNNSAHHLDFLNLNNKYQVAVDASFLKPHFFHNAKIFIGHD